MCTVRWLEYLSFFVCQTVSSILQISVKPALQYVIMPHFYAEFENTQQENKLQIKRFSQGTCKDLFLCRSLY